MTDTLDPLTQSHHDLQSYTLTHSGPEFIHQHVVDAWCAQYADENTKPIAITFALIGLYLYVVCGRSGRDVQRAHMRLARQGGPWLTFTPPTSRGRVTVLEVMAAPGGVERDRAIRGWCEAVWSSWAHAQRQVAQLVTERGLVAASA